MPRSPCVLLISPGIIRFNDRDFGLPHLVSIGGYLQSHTKVRVEIIDLDLEEKDHNRIGEALDDIGPFLVAGISCYSSFDFMRVQSFAAFMKSRYPDTPLVVGGYHAAALPEDFFYEGSPFDAVVPGEGEKAMLEITEKLLGGESLEKKIHERSIVEDMDSLPPFNWNLLNRYRNHAIRGRGRFQIYLSRGCPYKCTFCMERSKGGYSWRAFSPERAVDELRRLFTFIPMNSWVVNIADPLFGFRRNWRRQVLEGILEHKMKPLQFWTLTRSDDLQEEDVQLFARANFSIGIGIESGSPKMLKTMQKCNHAEKYIESKFNLAKQSRKHGLNWAGNIILGHPGERPESLLETGKFAEELFVAASETCGWLSVDPFRLYPGSHVHENMKMYEERYGTVFHHPKWWKSWYNSSFRAEHIDPGKYMDYETRVNMMYSVFSPLITKIHEKFRGQGGRVDRIFENSLKQQAHLMSEERKELLLRRSSSSKKTLSGKKSNKSENNKSIPLLSFPIGLRIRDEWSRLRESAVRRHLESGKLKTDRIVESLLNVRPENYMNEADAKNMLLDRMPVMSMEGETPPWLGFRNIVLGFEALSPMPGDRVADLLASNGYIAALLSGIVGKSGRVIAACPGSWIKRMRIIKEIKSKGLENIIFKSGKASTLRGLHGPFRAVWLGAALPRLPDGFIKILESDGGKIVTCIGPRFGVQDLVCITRINDKISEKNLGRVKAPILAGPWGWIESPEAPA